MTDQELLQAYKDTGLEPEEIMGLCEMDRRAKMADLLRLEEYQALGPIGHLRELVQAENDGRLVMLDSQQLPLIWGDDDHNTVLCPNCKHDLMGGLELADRCEVPMYQCPYCGQPVDGAKTLTREEEGGDEG